MGKELFDGLAYVLLTILHHLTHLCGEFLAAYLYITGDISVVIRNILVNNGKIYSGLWGDISVIEAKLG